MNKPYLLHPAGIVGSLALCGPLLAHDPGYRIAEIDPLPGHEANCAMGMNSQREVVGWSRDADGKQHAFSWSAGVGQALPVPADVQSAVATGINDGGLIVGYVEYDDGRQHAVAWAKEQFIDLGDDPSFGESSALGLNNDNVVVGSAFLHSLSGERAIQWHNGSPTVLDSLGGNSAALDINDSNDIVGWSEIEGVKHAFLLDTDTMQMTDLGLLPDGSWSIATAISDDGVVVGYGEVQGEESGTYGFKWDPQTQQMEQLDTLGSDSAWPRDVSAAEFIVGSSILGGTGDMTAALWRPDRLININALLLPGSPWDWLEEANAINNEGQIAGCGLLDGMHHAFVLEPVLGLANPIPGNAGTRNTFDAAGASPGNIVYFIYGFDWGEAKVPGCGGAMVNIKQPKIMAKKKADRIGHAIFEMPIPKSAKNKAVIFQAVEPQTCEVSAPIAWVFY